MPTATCRKPVHVQPEDTPSPSLGLLALAAMPPSQANALLLLLDLLHSLPKEDLAIIATTIRPELTDDVIADLCGVTTRTLYNWDRYRSWKPSVADYLATKQRQWYMPPDDIAS